ncbi:hypothetical protein MFLAVUS_003685 [Mucor flavus]|uniref:CRAL-TRIO domain-containing protein n=1 Tax=Mucor flavus TaxID=439312 RepID=A0ABP9YTU4_9FUNG
MVSLEQQERVVFLNSQYQDNSELIHRLSKKLLQDIHSLGLTPKDFSDAKEYIQDKVTIFRFLRECKFDLDQAHERLLKTISWRIENSIADLSFESCIEFFENAQGAFAYFHKTDKSSRPLIFVRLRYFPTEFRDPTKKLVHHIERYTCLMMEMARKLTWSMTCDRENKDEACVLVSQITAVVNIQKAPMLPLDAEIIKTVAMILDERYPGMVSTVNVLNFGWMYQGIWAIVKFLLSEEAKNSIRFTTVNELKPLISPNSILQEMGGNDAFRWSLELDKILQNYGSGRIKEQLPHTPPTSEDRSRSNSISDGEDVFFDADDALPSIPLSPPLPEHIPPMSLNTTSLTSRAGLRMGTDFLTSFIDTTRNTDQQQRRVSTSIEHVYQPSSVIVVNAPSQKKAVTGLKHLELVSKRFVNRILQLTFGQQRGAMYWILLYFFLRGPVESFIRKSLQRTPLLGSPHLKTTTIGITAVIATVFSTSLSDTVKKYRREK